MPTKKNTEQGDAFCENIQAINAYTIFGQFHFPDSLTRFTEAKRKYISVRDVTNDRNMRYEYRGQEIKQNCKS